MEFWMGVAQNISAYLILPAAVFIFLGIRQESRRLINATAIVIWLEVVVTAANGVMHQISRTSAALGWYVVAFICAMSALMLHFVAARVTKPSG